MNKNKNKLELEKREETKKLIHFFVSTTIISIVGIVYYGIHLYVSHKSQSSRYQFVFELVEKPIISLLLLSVLSGLIVVIKKSKDLEQIDRDIFKSGS